MNTQPSNYHHIRSAGELPTGYGSAVDLCIDDEIDALRYAWQNRTRQVYWIEEQQTTVWFQLLRRAEDLRTQVLA